MASVRICLKCTFFHIDVGIHITSNCSSCFVQFLADQFVSEPATQFQTGRTVMAKVCSRKITSRLVSAKWIIGFSFKRSTVILDFFFLPVCLSLVRPLTLSKLSCERPLNIDEGGARVVFLFFASLPATLGSFPSLAN